MNLVITITLNFCLVICALAEYSVHSEFEERGGYGGQPPQVDPCGGWGNPGGQPPQGGSGGGWGSSGGQPPQGGSNGGWGPSSSGGGWGPSGLTPQGGSGGGWGKPVGTPTQGGSGGGWGRPGGQPPQGGSNGGWGRPGGTIPQGGSSGGWVFPADNSPVEGYRARRGGNGNLPDGNPPGESGGNGKPPVLPPNMYDMFPACVKMAETMRAKQWEMIEKGEIGPTKCQDQDPKVCIQRDMEKVRCEIEERPEQECMVAVVASMKGSNCKKGEEEIDWKRA